MNLHSFFKISKNNLHIIQENWEAFTNYIVILNILYSSKISNCIHYFMYKLC